MDSEPSEGLEPPGVLVEDLVRPDRRGPASNESARGGAVAAEALVRALTDPSSPVTWREAAPVLRRIGHPAFDRLARGLLDAPTAEAREEVGHAFIRLGAGVVDRYAAALSHPSPLVRRQSVRGIGLCAGDGRTALPALLPLLGDTDREVSRQARDTLMAGDKEAAEILVPLLRRIRRDGPGRQRAGALSVLAQLGGESVLSERDVAAIERLVRVKAPDERPTAPWTCWNHWIAVPGGDQAGIIETLGLVGPRQVTFALGNDIVDADSHEAGPDDPSGYARVFVTPELDGWTFVLGAWCDPCDAERAEDVLRLCTRLSARFGSAQAYYYGARGDGSAWLVAAHGTVVRRYCETGDGENPLLTLGDPLPFERARRAELGLRPEWDPALESDDDADEWKWAAFDLASDIAESFGASPLAIGPETVTRGRGVVALTPYGVAHGVPTGAHPV
ncbi:HEAT repeat domain-containing protein [Streptomyces sp. NPDC060198]|uniref:HEAT repeat domain-containing protein n=1 Tax=Streptomyces sp. NPDC060198 TaxID=3347070 RepID=UPI003652D2BA